MDQYLQQQDYVDTAVIPLFELDLSASAIRQSAGASEYLQSLTAMLEKQFKGRILLFPPVTYAKKSDRTRIAGELVNEIENTNFKHVFYITTDAEWRAIENVENIIWLPAIPTEHMDQSFKKSVMEDQLRQVLPLFIKQWSKDS